MHDVLCKLWLLWCAHYVFLRTDISVIAQRKIMVKSFFFNVIRKEYCWVF